MTGSSRPRRPRLEIACFSAESAIVAWKAGADRVELCHDQEAGGTTPTVASVEHVKKHVTIPVYMMIRPRGGNFVYSAHEFEQMRSDIDAFKPMVDGFVFGMLDSKGEVDVERTSEMVRRAAPLPCTFHRAFDKAKNLSRALEDVVTSGVHAVLSSGGKENAVAGSLVLQALIVQARDRVQLLPGGGVRAGNIERLQKTTGADVFHSSGIPAGQLEIDADEVLHMRALLRRDDLYGQPEDDESRSRHDSGQEDGLSAERRTLVALS